MELSLSLDAREVLFHLNYMGYRNVTKEQLKSFMIDLKKLIKYESQPQKSTTEIHFQSGPHSINIQRLFESHTATSKLKQREKHSADSKIPDRTKDHNVCKEKTKLIREKSANNIEKVHPKCCKHNKICKEIGNTDNQHNKENISKHDNNQSKDQGTVEKESVKSKMWIRPKSAQSTRQINPKKRNDPVALYQEYQKDWERFRNNICESSRSELRWKIREKLLTNH